MKKLFLIPFFIHSLIGFSQTYKFVEDDKNPYYVLDWNGKLDLSVPYPDGRWIIYDSNDTTRVRYHFQLKDNMVHGFFARYENAIAEYGSYYKDSLWTFLTNPEDTTFKTGTWRTRTMVSDINFPDKSYPHYYDTNGIFRETWLYQNGTIARDAYYKDSFGLTDLSYYDFDEKLTLKTLNSEQQSITTTYSNDSITSISISQNGCIHG